MIVFYLRFTLQLIFCESMLVFGEKRRKCFWVTFPLSVLFCCIVAYILTRMPYFSFCGMVYFGIIFIATFLIWGASFRLNIFDVVFFCTGGYAVQHAVFSLCRIITFFTGTPDISSLGGLIADYAFIRILPYVAAGLAMYFFVMRRMRSSGSLGKKSLAVLLMSLLVLLTTLILSELSSFRYQDSELNLFTTRVVCHAYAIIGCVSILAMQLTTLQKEKIERDKEMQQQIYKLRSEQYSFTSDLFEQVNMKFHDIKHQLKAVQLMDEKSRGEYLRDLENSIGGITSIVRTGNPSLNVVLTEKALMSRKIGVRIEHVINSDLSFLSEIDLYTLFGNALDNAIRSAAAMPEEDKYVGIYIREEVGVAFIKIENRYSGDIVFRDGLPVSKGDKAYHGYGMKSIAEIVKRNGGEYEISAKDGVFCLNIMFPLNKK